jgi:hypothetical protein
MHTLIKLAIPANSSANADDLAKAILAKAILKIARKAGVEFAKRWEPFTLESGKQSYIIGKDILPKFPSTWNMQELWRTDIPSWSIPIKRVGDWSAVAAGGTGTGAPRVATIAGSPATLWLYPIPDSAYAVKALVKKKISALADVPVDFHDILIDEAYLSIAAAKNVNAATKLLEADEEELMRSGLAGWDGDTIPFTAAPGLETEGTGYDSTNLR